MPEDHIDTPAKNLSESIEEKRGDREKERISRMSLKGDEKEVEQKDGVEGTDSCDNGFTHKKH